MKKLAMIKTKGKLDKFIPLALEDLNINIKPFSNINKIDVSKQIAGLYQYFFPEKKIKPIIIRNYLDYYEASFWDDLQLELKHNGQKAEHYIQAALSTILVDISPLDVAILHQFMWQVKRKLFHKPVMDPIMPVFYNPQDAGEKIPFIENLCKIFTPCYTDIPIKKLINPRFTGVLSRTFINYVPELPLARELQLFKGLIKSQEVNIIKRGQFHYATCPNRCTFIGATNKPLPEGRFYQLNYHNINNNNINFIDIWKSVDENEDIGPITHFIGYP
jgi:hypothetical protein